MDAGERLNVSREIMFTHFTHATTFLITRNMAEHNEIIKMSLGKHI